jgi:hypothetical protein
MVILVCYSVVLCLQVVHVHCVEYLLLFLRCVFLFDWLIHALCVGSLFLFDWLIHLLYVGSLFLFDWLIHLLCVSSLLFVDVSILV